MRLDLSAVRRKAWATRRERYGPRGHSAPYRSVDRCPRCADLEARIAVLEREAGPKLENVTRETGAT